MEWLFRRHFWIVHLAFLALTAIILASAISIYIEYSMTNASVSVDKSLSQGVPRVPPRNFERATERNLFGARREPPATNPGNQVGNCDQWWNAMRTSLQVRLSGTAVYQDSRNSIALIEDSRRGGLVQSYSINDCLDGQSFNMEATDIFGPTVVKQSFPCNQFSDGGIIKRIETECVYFYNGSSGQCEYLPLGMAQCESSAMLSKPFVPPVISTPTPPTTPQATSNELGKSIKRTGPNSFEIDGSDLDNILSNLSMLFTQARTVPAFEGGKAVGFKFLSVMPNSVFSKLGFDKEDILNSINGYEMSAEKATQLLQKLQTDSQFNVQGNRGGVSFSYEYNIKR